MTSFNVTNLLVHDCSALPHFSSRHAGLLRERSSECILWTVQDNVALQSSGLQNKTQLATSYQSHTWHHLKIQIPFRSKSIVESITSLLMTTTCWWIVRKGKPWHTLEPSWWVSQRYECEAQTQNMSSLNYGDENNSRRLERQVLYSNTWNRIELDIWYTMYD